MSRRHGTPNNVRLPLSTQQDLLAQIQQAADLLAQTSHVLRPALGAAWTNRSLRVFRQVMAYRADVEYALKGGRLFVAPPSQREAAPANLK